MKAVKTWVLVCDGERSQVYEESPVEPRLRPVPETHRVNEAPDPRYNQDTERDTGHSSVGNRRFGVNDRIDPRQKMEDQFVLLQLEWLAERHAAFDRLIIVAPPKAMGSLRKAIPAGLKDKIAGEITADLTRTPLPEIAARVLD